VELGNNRKGAQNTRTFALPCSREIEKNGTGRGKKSGAKAKVRAWEVRAIRIAKLDRAVQEDPSSEIPADNPAL
jgi:hypothetical protein